VADERDPHDVWARCERAVGIPNPRDRDPRATLRALAERAPGVDDVDHYGKYGLAERLEARAAALLGKEEAVWMPSGTMAQQIALRLHAERRGIRRVAFHPYCHLDDREERGYAELHGLHAQLLGTRERLITADDVAELAEPVAAVLLELPQRDLGGRLPEWDELVATCDAARAKGAALHLDGARLWQCGPFYERGLDEIAALFDTVYVSLYKDLGGLGGCVLAGDDDVIAEARVWRVRHGGRLSTYEAMALSAERGLDEVLPRMRSFVRKAKEIGIALAAVDGIEVVPDPPQVSMLHVFVRGELERLRDAKFEIAKETRTVIAGYFAPTSLPNVQRTELGIGAPSLEVPTTEIAELYAELVERATSAPRRRRSAQASSARKSTKRGARRPPTRRR
jgi:threonine aldolase